MQKRSEAIGQLGDPVACQESQKRCAQGGRADAHRHASSKMDVTCRQEPDTTITDVVYLDVGYCPAGANPNRTLGESAVCRSTDALGRIIIGEASAQPRHVFTGRSSGQMPSSITLTPCSCMSCESQCRWM